MTTKPNKPSHVPRRARHRCVSSSAIAHGRSIRKAKVSVARAVRRLETVETVFPGFFIPSSLCFDLVLGD